MTFDRRRFSYTVETGQASSPNSRGKALKSASVATSENARAKDRFGGANSFQVMRDRDPNMDGTPLTHQRGKPIIWWNRF